MDHRAGIKRLSYLFFHLLLILLLMAANPPAINAQGTSDKSFESRQAMRFAGKLMDDHRYVEAISFLNSELGKIDQVNLRLPLLLLLADASMGIGDLEGAKAAISEAKSLSIADSDKNAVASRERRFSKMKSLPQSIKPSLGIVDDAGQIPQDSLESEAITEPAPLITNSFFETDLRQVLADLAMAASIPIVWDNTVQGLVTYEAVDEPLEEVLKAILIPSGFTYSFKDGKYFVGSSNPEDLAFGLLSETAVVGLSNISSSEAITMLSDFFKPYVKASKTTNCVCITAPPATVARIKDDLRLLDAPPVQILIEVVVTEISNEALRKMGLDWSLTRSTGNNPWNIVTNHTDIDPVALAANYADMAVDMGKYTAELSASLAAMVQSGEAKIRANPRIATVNGSKAEIGITKDQYFVIQTGTSQNYQYNTLQSVSSGIKLEITPFASESGEITVYVKPEVGDVVGAGVEGLPEISKRTAATVVRVKNAETFTIGGLNIQSEKINRVKIPLLGSIPILGYLFRYDQHEVKDTQIVIFVTPYIL
ncbi:MAG: hypothetical protein CO189_01040 [candidate division Zixibacteria bacterium CG_4_9_14_3_um_filter_46_8]|nr:MAG: hypothetical protein CO189_01040 [candidate division Zixibacteria bacterium CG_4_9_14_3_um_filter_46_8]